MGFWVDISTLENVMSFSSGVCGLRWEISFELISHIGKVLLSLWLLLRFLLYLVFRSWTVMCFGVNLFRFILLGVHSASWICHFVPFAKFGKFFFEYCSAVPFFFSPKFLMTCRLIFWNSPTHPWCSAHFFLSLFLWLDWIISIVLLFSSLGFFPPPCPLLSVLSPFVELFNFSYWSKLSIWFSFLSSVSLLRLYFFILFQTCS